MFVVYLYDKQYVYALVNNPMEAAPANPVPTPPAPAPPVVFNANEAISKLSEQGYRVYAKDFAFDPTVQTDDPLIKEIINKTASSLYVGLDKDIFELTGIPKLHPNEKTYEYNKRVTAQLKDQIKNAPDVATVKSEYETRLTKKDQAIAEIALRSAVNGLKLNVPDESLDSQRELLIMRAMGLPHRIGENGEYIPQKFADDGKTLIDELDPTTGRPKPVDAFVAGQFKPFLKVDAPVPSGPNAKAKPADTSGPAPTTQADLVKMLDAEGVPLGGPQFMTKLKALATQYAITLRD